MSPASAKGPSLRYEGGSSLIARPISNWVRRLQVDDFAETVLIGSQGPRALPPFQVEPLGIEKPPGGGLCYFAVAKRVCPLARWLALYSVTVRILRVAGRVAPVEVLRRAATKMPVTAGMQGHHFRLGRQLVDLQAHGAVSFHLLEVECHDPARGGGCGEREDDALITLVLGKHLDPHFAGAGPRSTGSNLVSAQSNNVLLVAVLRVNVTEKLGNEPE